MMQMIFLIFFAVSLLSHDVLLVLHAPHLSERSDELSTTIPDPRARNSSTPCLALDFGPRSLLGKLLPQGRLRMRLRERDWPPLTYLFFTISGIAISAGGPALVQALRPSDEELVKRYNPDLRKRSEEQGDKKAQEFDDYVIKLKEWSKSDKSSMSRTRGMDYSRYFRTNVILFLVWVAAQEELDAKRALAESQKAKAKEETRVQREEMRKEMLGEK